MTLPTEPAAQAALKSFIERIERMNEDKAAIADDIKVVFAEAKARGFDNKVMRLVIKQRAMDTSKRLEQREIERLYLEALGMEA